VCRHGYIFVVPSGLCDITYLKTEEGNCYLTMITDAWSRKIIVYCIADNMETVTIAEALKMAITNR
jgi:putative transposase